MKLTDEEHAELEALEKEEKDRLAAEVLAAKRQHLDALRMSKRLSAKHGKPGHDFIVLETKVGNVAVRRPNEVELDSYESDAEDTRAQNEQFAASVVIEPPADDVRALMAANPGLAGPLVMHAVGLVKVMREEEAKK